MRCKKRVFKDWQKVVISLQRKLMQILKVHINKKETKKEMGMLWSEEEIEIKN